jgi:hypothetical protein
MLAIRLIILHRSNVIDGPRAPATSTTLLRICKLIINIVLYLNLIRVVLSSLWLSLPCILTLFLLGVLVTSVLLSLWDLVREQSIRIVLIMLRYRERVRTIRSVLYGLPSEYWYWRLQ